MAKREAYPILLRPVEDGFFVDIPDFDISTQGDTIAEGMEMARDAIGVVGIDMQDDGEELPAPNSAKYKMKTGDILTYVDIDFEEYRRKIDNRSIRKNCTIPYWLSVEADRADINYSRVLQDALANILDVSLNVTR